MKLKRNKTFARRFAPCFVHVQKPPKEEYQSRTRETAKPHQTTEGTANTITAPLRGLLQGTKSFCQLPEAEREQWQRF